MAANFEISKTNYTIVENNNLITQANFRRWFRYMSEFSYASFAMTEFVVLNNNLLRDFVSSVNVVNVGPVLGISCNIQGRTIHITENTLNTALHQPTDNFEDVLDKPERISFFMGIHCIREATGALPSKIYVRHLPRE